MFDFKPKVTQRLEVTCPPSFAELVGDLAFYRETYNEFANEIYFPRSSIVDASEEFKQTPLYAELKAVFDSYPDFHEVFLV